MQLGDFMGAFAFFGYGLFVLMMVAAAGVFSYSHILQKQKSEKDALLAQKEASIDPKTADGFVRLQNRLQSGKTLIANHVALSRFFSDFDTLIPTGVRFASLDLSPVTGASGKLTAAGSARTFNQLAVLSSNFAADGNIRDAIFSNLTVDPKTGAVTFALTASVDPAITAFSAEAVARAALSATTTAPAPETTTANTP